MRKSPAPYSTEAARDVAIRALTFLTGDASILSRFLDVTGWTPETLASPGSRAAILAATLDYLMSEEDLLLTFSANCGLDPSEVALANRALQSGNGFTPEPGS
jgi:hypothetical protein